MTAYAGLFPSSTTRLYCIAAANSSFDLDNADVLAVPQEPLKAAQPGNVLIVGALGGTATEKADYSDYGTDTVDLYASGSGWTSLAATQTTFSLKCPGKDGPGTALCDGTSFAAPVVAGAAALAASLNPGFLGKGGSLRTAVMASTEPSVSVTCGGNTTTMRPRLNARALLDQSP